MRMVVSLNDAAIARSQNNRDRRRMPRSRFSSRRTRARGRKGLLRIRLIAKVKGRWRSLNRPNGEVTEFPNPESRFPGYRCREAEAANRQAPFLAIR